MNNILITCKKELRAIFRDKKFLSIIFLLPLIIPAFILFMGFLYDDLDSVSKFTIGVNYEMKEEEVNFLKSVNKDIEIVKEDTVDALKKDYDEGTINAYLTIEDDTYNLYVDTSNTEGMTISGVFDAYFNMLNEAYANEYLSSRGIDPNVVLHSINYNLKDQAKEGTNFFTNFLVSFALCYLVMIITITAMNTTTDIIAGEKERGTFETLLTFPISSNEIITGKLLAIVVSCIISSLIGVATSIPAFAVVKFNTQVFKDMSINIGISTVLYTILVLVLLSCLVGVISIFLCGKAKTFKEAQSKVSFLSFLSMIPMFASLANTSSEILYLIPVVNGGTILNDLFSDAFALKNMLMFIVSSVVVTIIVTSVVSKQYKDEKALF